MNWLSETPRTLICALAEWYGKRISRLFCIRRFLQRATRIALASHSHFPIYQHAAKQHVASERPRP